MFFKKPDPSPKGVPLSELEEALAATTLKPKRKGDTLFVHHEQMVTEVGVIEPANRESENGPISAVITIKTPLPSQLNQLIQNPTMVSTINSMATLGAITEDNGNYFIGSRLTVYEAEKAWNIQFPLILFSIIAGIDPLLGAARKIFSGEVSQDGTSEWGEEDLQLVETYLSRLSVCNAGGLGLTAEFGLKSGAVSAGLGDHDTALWQIMADQPHPELGGGLFCLLQMPHQIEDEGKLDRVIADLNRMEMAPHDLVPHFGAWCRGNLGNNPAYVSFLPNVLHQEHGIAVNVSIWAMHRAHWADAMMVALGAR